MNNLPPVQRNTMQKAVVLKTVRAMHDHPTADMVYSNLHREYPTISKATVYRILKQLSESREIKKIAIPGGADRYDFNTMIHYHIRCTVCGNVEDVETESIPQIEHPRQCLTDSSGYRSITATVMFEGICPICGASPQ